MSAYFKLNHIYYFYSGMTKISLLFFSEIFENLFVLFQSKASIALKGTDSSLLGASMYLNSYFLQNVCWLYVKFRSFANIISKQYFFNITLNFCEDYLIQAILVSDNQDTQVQT